MEKQLKLKALQALRDQQRSELADIIEIINQSMADRYGFDDRLKLAKQLKAKLDVLIKDCDDTALEIQRVNREPD